MKFLTIYFFNFFKINLSLNKLKNFPNDSLIIPNEDSGLNNLIFAKFLDPKNEIIDYRVNLDISDITGLRCKSLE